MRSARSEFLGLVWAWVALIVAIAGAPFADAQETPAAAPSKAVTLDEESPLQFAFDGTPWRQVIKWLADESNLALHVSSLPTGSFTYADPNSYTPDGAISRVNLFLLPQGFTLVRSGKLLSVINLGDPRSMQQLDSLASLVTVQQLEQLNTHDVVKCIFPLGEIDAEDAVEELGAIKLMTTPAVFTRTNRLMIIDTVGKLRNVKVILDAFQPDTLDNGTLVESFPLEHVVAEDILTVARPHLGLATGEMIGIDVSVSADLQGKNIFVTGVADKVKMIQRLIAALDTPKRNLSNDGESELRSHVVKGGNVEMVYNVLLTLLANQSVRLSMDETAGTIIALATPEIQGEIAQTVAQLQAAEADFEVIPLKTVDPYFAISLLEEMLDLPDPLFDDPETIDPDAPKIDADPSNMRLFVRAKKYQIEQIKKIIDGLDVSSIVGGSETIRVLPLKGRQVIELLETAAKFWRRENPIVLYPSIVSALPQNTERVVNGESSKMHPHKASESTSPTQPARHLTNNTDSQAPPIRCQLTPRGLLLQSDDTEALDQFEQHIRTIAGPLDSMPTPPIVFYLKYTKPDDAIRMLAELLDGGESATSGEAESLVNGYVSSSSSSLLGSLVTSRQGATTMTFGTMTVVADSRLNRLIAQGTASDIELIEDYLKIVDKDNSITTVETYGTSHVIELVHTKASEVATVIRGAYAGRVSATTNDGRPKQAGTPQSGQAQRESAAKTTAAKAETRREGDEQESERKSPEKKPGGQPRTNQPARNLEPTMTIAVHEPSNSLIVTAPAQLFKQVEQLVMLLDVRSEQTVDVITTTNAAGIHSKLRQVLFGETPSSSVRSGAPSPPVRSPSPPPASTPSFRGRPNGDTRRGSNR